MHNRLAKDDLVGTPWQEVSRNASALCSDAFELAELQAKLVRTDFSAFRKQLFYPLWMIPLAIGLFLAGLPTLAFALAGTLSALFNLSETLGQWIVGGSFFVIAGALVLIAAKIIVRSFRTFSTSQKEFDANLKWLRQSLASDRERSGTEVLNQFQDL